ncbi:MAG: hypothetical protein WC667_04835 [Sulfurimonas sp.]|jgi:hypothetical protein
MSENSEKILYLILQKLEDQEELLLLTISSLTTKKAVANFLKKTDRTIDNYIANGTFKESEQYFHNENGKIEFIPMGILNYRRYQNLKKEEIPKIEMKKIYHPSVKSIVEGLKLA